MSYYLLPKDEGHYKVSANIEIYESEDCTGISVPISLSALSVMVSGDMGIEVPQSSADIVAPEVETMHEVLEPQSVSSVQEPGNMQAPLLEDVPSDATSDYKIVLSVDSTMYLGQAGMMEVWLGGKTVDVTPSNGMKQDEKTFSKKDDRGYAKIVPYAPGFEIKTLFTTVCHEIDPGGSELRYSLVPKDEGHYKVSADIEFYKTEDCTGTSVSKLAKAVTVLVSVDMNKEISKSVHKMEEVVMSKFMIFWTALITLIFAAAIFVVRRYIKNKTGYEEGPTS